MAAENPVLFSCSLACNQAGSMLQMSRTRNVHTCGITAAVAAAQRRRSGRRRRQRSHVCGIPLCRSRDGAIKGLLLSAATLAVLAGMLRRHPAAKGGAGGVIRVVSGRSARSDTTQGSRLPRPASLPAGVPSCQPAWSAPSPPLLALLSDPVARLYSPTRTWPAPSTRCTQRPARWTTQPSPRHNSGCGALCAP